MNVLDALGRMDNESVDCIVTSPPYYGLRSYKGAETLWGANPMCEHSWIESSAGLIHENRNNLDGGTLNAKESGAQAYREQLHGMQKTPVSFCSLCGAWKGQLGLEPTYQLYLNHLMLITAELKRVLKPTGTMWWNCGDSYAGNQGKRQGWTYNSMSGETNEEAVENGTSVILKADYGQLQDKSRMMLPERFAMKLIDEQQWTLRNDIVWSKPNHMPSSVKDRLSNGWEHIYLFTKARKYYFNLDAIREQHKYPADDIRRIAQDAQAGVHPFTKGSNAARHNKHDEAVARHGSYDDPLHCKPLNAAGKNPGDVWSITTRPYREAHFATFPPELPLRCIKAGCPDEVCTKCGKPKEAIVEVVGNHVGHKHREDEKHLSCSPGHHFSNNYQIKGYRPTCSCSAPFIAGTVLDPFAGSGTTLMVAMQRRLNAIGIEIKPDYCKLIEKRCKVPHNLVYEYELITCQHNAKT